MTALEYLKYRSIISKDSKDLIIDFDDDSEVSLVKLLDEYYEFKLKTRSKARNESKTKKTKTRRTTQNKSIL